VKRFVVIVLVAACARRSPPVATTIDAERGNVELAQLEEGRKLLIRKCTNCHRVPLPSEHTPAQWPKLVDDMAERSSIDGAQHKLIEQYLVTMAAR
jgi:hypothetical protein